MKQEDVIWRQIVDANRTWMNGRAEDVGALFDEHAILAFVDTKEKRRVGEFATPWRRAVISISGSGNIFSQSDCGAKTRHQYPRTKEEALQGRTVDFRPLRT
jgi:hypothetical protein